MSREPTVRDWLILVDRVLEMEAMMGKVNLAPIENPEQLQQRVKELEMLVAIYGCHQ